MSAGGSFWPIVIISIYLFALWGAGKVAKIIGISTIIAEIGVGIALSSTAKKLIPAYTDCHANEVYDCNNPYWLETTISGDDVGVLFPPSFIEHYNGRGCPGELLPELYDQEDTLNSSCWKTACETRRRNECQNEPDMFTMIGHAGVSLMIFESGMHFDFNQLRSAGPPAMLIAVVGTLLPIVTGYGLTYAFDPNVEPIAALAVGISMAPTSVGISLKMLMEHNSLQMRFGQIIVIAAFVDDIFSLVAFQILFSAHEGKFTFVTTILPALCGVAALLLAAVLSVKVWPPVFQWILNRVVEKSSVSFAPRDNVLLVMMVVFLLGWSCIMVAFGGSHLWGCFAAGMSFADVKRGCHIWTHQTKRITSWMMRIFFASTVAWSIPLDDLLAWESIYKGAIMGILGCICTKLLAGSFMGDLKWVIGWAMCGRAEFAYLIAQMAESQDIMHMKEFSIVVWALLWATLSAPIIFSCALRRYLTRKNAKDSSIGALDHVGVGFMSGHQPSDSVQLTNRAREFRVLVLKKMNNLDIDHDLHVFFHAQQMIITSTASKCDDDNYMGIFGLKTRDAEATVDFLLRFRLNLFKMFQDNDARIVLLPQLDPDGQEAIDMIKITVIAESCPDLLSTIIHRIHASGLTVMQSVCELHHPVFVGGLTYFPHKGEYVIVCICQAGPDVLAKEQRPKHLFLRETAIQVKHAIKSALVLSNEILIETLSYDPDPLRALLHSDLMIDKTEEWLEDEEHDSVPVFYRIRIVVDRLNPALRIVGSCREIFRQTLILIEKKDLAVVVSRQDHLPLAPAPCLVLVAQCLKEKNTGGNKTQKAFLEAKRLEARAIETELKTIMDQHNFSCSVEVEHLGANPRADWTKMALDIHLDQKDTQSPRTHQTDLASPRGTKNGNGGDRIIKAPSFVDLHVNIGKTGASSPNLNRNDVTEARHLGILEELAYDDKDQPRSIMRTESETLVRKKLENIDFITADHKVNVDSDKITI